MKNLLIFLFGAACGAGGTMLWLRKDIKKELKRIDSERKAASDVPFVVGELEPEKNKMYADDNKYLRTQAKAQYHQVVNQYNVTAEPEDKMEENDISDVESSFSETDGGIFEIDCDTFMHDHSNEKVRLVYFRGDHIMSEENGTVITSPAMLVGGQWESCVGNYADRTAFIRNPRLVTDYEIYVEDGLYEDEYGVEDNYRED